MSTVSDYFLVIPKEVVTELSGLRVDLFSSKSKS